MKHKKILDEKPGRTVYEGYHCGEVYHYFTDTSSCPSTEEIKEIPGKGIIYHRISSFLFSKLNLLGVPTHFVRVVNMRESLMQATSPLPFDIKVHCHMHKDLSEDFHMPEGQAFASPILEYVGPYACSLNEDFLFALEWIEEEDLDALRAFVLQTVHFLQGIFVVYNLSLITLQLHLAFSPQGDFMLAGQLSPEFFCVMDTETQTYLGSMGFKVPHTLDSLISHGREIGHRLGLHIDPPFPLYCDALA